MITSAHAPSSMYPTPARLVLVPNLSDAAGEPLVALGLPPMPGAPRQRPVLRMFATVAAALSAKRSLEAAQ